MASIKKPMLFNANEALEFAEKGDSSKPAKTISTPAKTAQKAAQKAAIAEGSPKRKMRGGKSGLVPEGYTRLTANIPTELHIKLKVKAASEGRSIVDILEEVLVKNL